MASLDTVVQLLNQLIIDNRVLHDSNKALKDQLTGMQGQLTALQTAPAPKSRGKAAASNPVGVGANGQVEKKFPNNTIVWLKTKSNEDPTFLPQLLGQNNYDSFANKYIAELKSEDPKEYHGKLAEKIWKDLQALAENSTHQQTKDFAAKMTDHLRATWKKEKDAWLAAHPPATTVPSAPASSGTVIPDTPVLQVPVTPQLTQLSFDSSALQQPLLQPMSLQLPLLQPVGVAAR